MIWRSAPSPFFSFLILYFYLSSVDVRCAAQEEATLHKYSKNFVEVQMCGCGRVCHNSSFTLPTAMVFPDVTPIGALRSVSKESGIAFLYPYIYGERKKDNNTDRLREGHQWHTDR